ncbi:hypothetical protein POM88_012685 [Heracleum sosnowskyi]|uniref:Transposase MuDR plant domain-containing protein n=1 Tax=Heracleum sosnowskyi TaxID=360622 RepID=A0AAD8IYN3_9APIA|nr:hypothetical protein POM88_012685 [Heracleum sosnowskyi]
MVRTRSGIEVRLTQKDNDEDEFVDEDAVEEEQIETAGEDDNVDEDDNAGEEEEMGTNGEQTEMQNKLYEVTLYYGGDFVHVPYESYTSHVKKVHNDIDFENISMDELKLCFGATIGEFDSLYFRTPELRISLLNAESKPKLIELNRERDGYCYSDEEFAEIRKASREEKKKMDEFEKESNLAEMYEMEFEDSDSDRGFYPSSEESDEEFCYDNPHVVNENIKYVDEVFNVHTAAKDIKFKVGQIFGSKKDFKEVVRSSSMESGRPYWYSHDDLKRVQVRCAQGCPFKLWLGYIEDRDMWQIRSIIKDHNCVWSYKNKLVSTKYLVEQFGDRIRKNPNWKLCEMQEEFKRVLKVDVCDSKCSGE